jgi:hypothetical protein
MDSWLWLIAAFIGGGSLGILTMALMNVSARSNSVPSAPMFDHGGSAVDARSYVS